MNKIHRGKDLNSKAFIETVKQKYKYYTNKEVADHFGVTRSRISQWINSNKVPKRYIDKERYEEMDLKSEPSTEINDYKKIINKQLNHIELLEEKIKSDKFKRSTFIKEVADNWDYDVKIILKFNSLRETQLEDIITSKVKVKKLNDYLGYSREEFKNNMINWLNSPIFNKEEIIKLHIVSEKKRLSAIKHEIDSFVVSNHVRCFKKDGGYEWIIYRAHYDLNHGTCISKLKLLSEATLNE